MNKEMIVSYVKQKKSGIALYLIIFALLAFLFFLYNYNLMAVLYGFFLSGLLLLVFCIREYSQYKNTCINLKHAQNSSEDLLSMEISGPLPQQELMSQLQQSIKQLKSLETAAANQQMEMEAYYSMWVHQIKVPISAMQLILQSNRIPDSRVLKQELFKIEQYVEMALGYLRIESISSDLIFEAVDIHSMVSGCVKKFARPFIHKKLSVKIEDFDNKVVTDEKWLRFVLEQLLSNALKYTKSGGVKIYMDSNDCLYIEDSGMGIFPEDLPRIFERGFTGKNGRIDKASTGLGLFLVKKILDRLNHGIEISSVVGKGSMVKLNLKRQPIHPE